jgi:hypothetical protein
MSVGKGAKYLLIALAHASTAHDHKPAPYLHAFDTNSVLLHINNCASCSMLMDQNNFVGTLTKSNLGIKGISGTMRNASVGTVRWVIHNDEDKAHTVMLPNLLYVPNIMSRLLCPQHWAQVAHHDQAQGRVTCITNHNNIKLQ